MKIRSSKGSALRSLNCESVGMCQKMVLAIIYFSNLRKIVSDLGYDINMIFQCTGQFSTQICFCFFSYQYPTMAKLGEMVGHVIDHFK